MIQPSVESHVLVREQVFTITGRLQLHTLKELIDILHLERNTGKLTINLSQGSVQSCAFEERARINSR